MNWNTLTIGNINFFVFAHIKIRERLLGDSVIWEVAPVCRIELSQGHRVHCELNIHWSPIRCKSLLVILMELMLLLLPGGLLYEPCTQNPISSSGPSPRISRIRTWRKRHGIRRIQRRIPLPLKNQKLPWLGHRSTCMQLSEYHSEADPHDHLYHPNRPLLPTLTTTMFVVVFVTVVFITRSVVGFWIARLLWDYKLLRCSYKALSNKINFDRA